MVIKEHVKVADQVWIALALLTREHPDREGFTSTEIVDRVRTEFGHVSPGIPTHIHQHCVAIKPPNPGRYRIITRTDTGLNRLFKLGDPYHPDRADSKYAPARDDLPAEHEDLLDWYLIDHTKQLKVLTLDSLFFKIAPGRSGLHDVSERHDYYLTEDFLNNPNLIRRQ